MEISIVITNWNGTEILKETLPTVMNAAVMDPDHYYEVLLIDDCSTDSSISYVRENYPDIRIVSTPANKGYMHANNFGVKQAKNELVFCMNNDMKITPKTISSLVPHFQSPGVFAASGKIFDWEEQFLYGNRGGRFEKGHFSYFEKPEDDIQSQTLFACGGAFLCRKSMYLSLGGYDADLFSPYYYDETDLCFRALKRGFEIIYEPSSHAFHKVAQTASRQYEDQSIKVISARNNYFFSIKNIHDEDWTSEMVRFIPLFLLRDACKGKFRFWKAFYRVLKNWSLLMERRRIEKDKGGISDREIFQKVCGTQPEEGEEKGSQESGASSQN